ncbi:OLC1v1012211C1 [Oldenlandia corymbosa var. corymbosa]|uniref:OLC1v1012211C1 n=1 Tax=Oldenlandia corymbosa var. corymbosa TaxID=529605 RepID=A0AAV1DYH7_OLDCO|nr:OLC1v1012211C1 [Oldenlandia corymbosa var. corymbosa]
MTRKILFCLEDLTLPNNGGKSSSILWKDPNYWGVHDRESGPSLMVSGRGIQNWWDYFEMERLNGWSHFLSSLEFLANGVVPRCRCPSFGMITAFPSDHVFRHARRDGPRHGVRCISFRSFQNTQMPLVIDEPV